MFRAIGLEQTSSHGAASFLKRHIRMPRAANPVDAYARSVKSGKVPAGKYHRLACVRHLEDRKREKTARYPYRFDAGKAAKVVQFFALLKHYKGEWSGQPIVLEPWQVFIVGSVFGWVHKKTGLRRFRKSYVEIPRKNGKSLLAAGMILYGTFFDGEPGAEGYVAAMKRDQAKIVFGDAKKLVQTSGLRSRIKVNVGNMHQEATASKLEPLSSEHDSMDGLNVHICILDEFHAQKVRGIIDVMETAMGARRQPHLFEITTAGDDPLSPCGVEHDYACRLLTGIFKDETFFTFIAHADEGDDPFKVATWKKANPNYGISVKPEDLRALAKKARQMPSALATFRQKRLNVWVNTSTPWLNLEGWRKGQSEWEPDILAGRACWGGTDLSSKADLSAFVLVFPPVPDDSVWRLLCWFFTPEDEVELHAQRARAPYQQWIDEGYIAANPGTRIDQNVILETIREAAGTYNLQFVGFDPWNAEKLVTDLNESWGDERAVVIDQTFKQLSDPSKEFEVEVAAGRVDAGGNPVMAWMVANVVIIMDGNANIRPTKDPKKSRGRIDGVVAAIMGIKLAISQPEEPEVSMEVGVLTW